MANSKFVTGYLKWDGKKYVIDSTLACNDDKVVVNVDDDNSRILYFYSGKCKIIQK